MITAVGTGKYRNEFFLRFIVDNKYRIYRHLILLIFIISGIYNGKNILTNPANIYFKTSISVWLLSLAYLNTYVLIPNLIFKDRYLEYLLYVLLLFGVTAILFLLAKNWAIPYLKPIYRTEDDTMNIFGFLFIFTVITASSATLRLFKRWIVDSQRINQLETITIKSELEQLKNQINPHFLFNTLNNVNVLTHKDPEKASQILIKLSSLLRYQLYDSARDKVLLTADIRFLEDFFNLEQIRRDNFEFAISKHGDLSSVRIAPLLFITFVENAVKHNVDAEKPSYIHLFFSVKDEELHFICTNSKPKIPPVNNGAGGLGLANVKRRLELLYPQKHTLSIRNEDDTFSVTLIIKI